MPLPLMGNDGVESQVDAHCNSTMPMLQCMSGLSFQFSDRIQKILLRIGLTLVKWNMSGSSVDKDTTRPRDKKSGRGFRW